MFFKRFKKNTFVANVAKVFGIKSIVLILSMISSIVAARLLGPDGKGLVTVAISIANLAVQFGNLGIHSANTYYLAKDKSILPRVVGNSTAVVAFVATVSFFLLYILNGFFKILTIEGITLILVIVYIPIQLYNMYLQNFFIALERVKKYSIMEMLIGILYPIFLVTIACFHSWSLTPNLAIFSSVITSLLTLTVGLFFLKEELKEKMQIDKELFFQMLPFGIKSYLSCLLTYLVLRVDIFMIDYYLNRIENGLYSLAVNLADIVNMIAISVSMLLFPKLSGIEDKEQRKDFINRTLKYMSIIMLSLVVCATICSEWAVLQLYGEEYTRSIPAFRILMPGIFFWALSSLLFNYFSSENRIDLNIRISLVGLVINIVSNFFLIKRAGIYGVATASTISYITIFVLLFYELKKRGSHK